MIYSKYKCSNEVLKQFRFIHCKQCEKKHSSCLNSYLNKNHPFERKKKYKLCKIVNKFHDDQQKDSNSWTNIQCLNLAANYSKRSFAILRDALNKDYFNAQKYLVEAKSEHYIICYDFHDGKMIYQLLQCSLCNQKHHPYIVCKCRRNAGIK